MTKPQTTEPTLLQQAEKRLCKSAEHGVQTRISAFHAAAIRAELTRLRDIEAVYAPVKPPCPHLDTTHRMGSDHHGLVWCVVCQGCGVTLRLEDAA